MEKSEEYGSLQRLVDALYARHKTVSQIELIVGAEGMDLCADLLEICRLVPPGTYARNKLCNQINSSLVSHDWGFYYGTVE